MFKIQLDMNGGTKMKLYYGKLSWNSSTYIVASTKKGLAFVGSPNQSLKEIDDFYHGADIIHDEKANSGVIKELKEYLSGKRTTFDISLDVQIGTPLQKSVWQQLRSVACGSTINYSELAEKVGHPTAIRAVASAVARNPILMIVPCHRVLRKDGSIGQYRGGVEMKRELLALEEQ